MQTLENDHMLVIVPYWMDAAIARSPRAQVAECIGREGLYRVGLLQAGLASRDETIRAVHALLYKSRELHIVDAQAVAGLAHTAVCNRSLDPSDALLLIYWYGTRDAPPDYAGADDEMSRMKAELCNQ